MLNLRALLETALEQGRRLLLQNTRHNYLISAQKNSCQRAEIPQPKLTQRLQKDCSGGKSEGKYRPFVVAECMPANGLSNPATSGGRLLNRLGPITSRLFQGLARKVSSPLWAEARRKANKSIVFGQTAPFFALVGVTLVSGPERGLVTKDDELEALCGDIREAISRAGWIHNPEFWQEISSINNNVEDNVSKGLCFEDIDAGTVIGKGANAVVYSARWRRQGHLTDTSNEEDAGPFTQAEVPIPQSGSYDFEQSDVLKQFLTTKEEESSVEGESVGDLSSQEGIHNLSALEAMSMSSFPVCELGYPSRSVSYSGEPDSSLAEATFSGSLPKRKRVKFKSVCELEDEEEILVPDITGGYSKRRMYRDQECEELLSEASGSNKVEYPLAIKMIFNYEAQSNAYAILSAMYKEIVPAQALPLTEAYQGWLQGRFGTRKSLPLHPNIVEMPCAFVDRIPNTKEGMRLFPDALPTRLNPSGFGRNMTLFCVMKRYDCSLGAYLSEYEPSTRTSMFMLAQLLEAVCHLNVHGIAHRDLKRDNILLRLNDGWEYPVLVISDFGCCLANSSGSLSIPFGSWEVDPREGNPALTAPEVKLATPGFLRSINYEYADTWTCGALSYEIFGEDNPFDPNPLSEKTLLDSINYKESQLARLPKRVPTPIRHLVADLLRCNPKQRPTPVIAATICQLVLWAPSKWLQKHTLSLPSHNEVTQWLLCLSTKILCEAGTSPSFPGESSRESRQSFAMSTRTCGQLEYEIVSTFLSRVHYADIMKAIKWTRAF